MFLGRTFALRDHLMFVRPLLVHLGRELRAGRLPEWWDGIGLGLPHLANPAHGVCYPPLWLLALLPESWGGDALLLAHFFLLGAGGLLFARQLGADRLGGAFAGAALMTSGYVASVVTSGSLFTLAWTPWVAWAADRAAAGAAQGGRAWQRAGALLAGLIAIQVLSGDPAGVLSSLLVATGVVLARAPRRGRAVLTLAAAVVAAAALAAVLLLPALLWARESERARGLPLAAASMWSLHPLRALEWVWPHALGDPIDPARNLARLVARAGPSEREPGFAYSLYLGAPALLLALVAAVRGRAGARGLLAGAAVLTVLAFGRYTPLYAAYRWLVLPERLLRYPEKHFAGAVVIVCALAGLGLREAFAQPPSRRLLLAASGLGAALLAGAAALALAPAAPLARLSARAAALAPPLDVSAALAVARAGALRAAAVVALLVGALVLARGDTRARAAAALTAAAAVLDLLVHGWSLQVLIARADCVRPPALLQPVLAAARPGAPRPRLYRLHTMAPGGTHGPGELARAMLDSAGGNRATEFGFAVLPGEDPAQSGRWRALWDAAAQVRGGGTSLLARYAVDYRIVPAPAGGALVLVPTPATRPRGFVSGRWQWLPTDDAVRAALLGQPYDAGLVRLSGAGAAAPGAARSDLAPCEIASPRPERVELRCTSPSAGYAVLLDTFAPGWSATVDGKAARIERAELLARAVAIEPGEHRIVLSYRTPGLRVGATVSAAAWLALLALLAQRRRSAGHNLRA
ncbi:MAG TPA: YfhO family protein [Polyangia bacterium]|nr:YfhO family protein [Polyangia bacterium]